MVNPILLGAPLLAAAAAAASARDDTSIVTRKACTPHKVVIETVTTTIQWTKGMSLPTSTASSLPAASATSVAQQKSAKVETTSAQSQSLPTKSQLQTVATSPSNPSSPSGTGSKNVLYFTNWSIYGANFFPQNITTDSISHLLYAFASISEDGTVASSDEWSDVQQLMGGASLNASANDAHGCVEQLYLLKKKNRSLKTLLSIGGWTYSQNGQFAGATSTPEGRNRFAQSAVKLMADWGFDGLDIDWEYPANPQQADEFVQLLRACRQALDDYASQNGQDYHYQLTVATAAGPQHYRKLLMSQMDNFLDAWHLMAYDYAGSWDDTTGYQDNLYPSVEDPASTKFNTNQAVNDYLATGIRPDKLILGLPTYGRSFLNTDGIGEPFSGVGGGPGLESEGVWLYRDLPRPGASVYFNAAVGATYSYDPDSRELVSFDDTRSTGAKAQYIRERGLGGALFWEAAGDKVGEDSLVRTMEEALGGLDETQNMLDYPRSQYDNIRNGMPDA